MSILLAIIAGLFLVCLILVTGMHPEKPRLSASELRRRSKRSKEERLELQRFEARPTLVVLLRVIRSILLVLFVCTLIGAFGWGLGVVLALVSAVTYPIVARNEWIRRKAQSLYLLKEPAILAFTKRLDRVVQVLHEPSEQEYSVPRRIYSREDLAELIQNSKEVINSNERLLLGSALAFSHKKVEEVMTPRSVINFIKQSEFLGPLVLSELHSLGHSRLPVINEDLDHIVGVLHIRDLLSLDDRNSATAQEVVEKKVFYIHENDNLEHALAAFLKTRHHLFIVINENRETVGLLTLEDTIEALIGRKIVDEDDIHADLRAVAAQEGRTNNTAAGHIDL